MTHTSTPWRLFNTPVRNNKFLRKIGPLIIGDTASDEDVIFAAEAVNSYASLVEENKRMREALEEVATGDWNNVHWVRSMAAEVIGDTNA